MENWWDDDSALGEHPELYRRCRHWPHCFDGCDDLHLLLLHRAGYLPNTAGYMRHPVADVQAAALISGLS